MKKYIFGGFTAAALLCSCSEDVMIEEVAASEAITFNAVADNSSRAVTSFCANNLPDTFCVFARTVEDTPYYYLNSNKVTKKEKGYEFADGVAHYWPNTALDFLAYAHDMETPTFNKSVSAPAFVDYTIASAAENQLDLIYAYAPGKTKANGTVNLNFRHALSQVIFRAQVVNKYIRVEINEVGVGGVAGKGTFALPTSGDTDTQIKPGHNDNVSTSTGFQGPTTGLGTWSALGKNGEFTATPAEVAKAAFGDSKATVVTSSPANHPADGDWNSVLSLIPQHADAWNPETGAAGSYLIVGCTIYNIAQKEGGEPVETVAHEGKLYIPVEVMWEQGVRYVYTLNFGAGDNAWTKPEDGDPEHALVPVSVEVTVDDFLPVGEKLSDI